MTYNDLRSCDITSGLEDPESFLQLRRKDNCKFHENVTL